MKRFLLLVAIVAMAIPTIAQRTVSGRVVESDSKEALAMTTVKLLKTDSTLVKGALTADNGSFKVTAPADGRYILKITCVGFKNYTRNITIADGKDVAIGTVSMSPDAIMLKGATITSHVAKVTLKEDTFVYNAAAYRVPEGSVLEDLVKKLPGAQIDDEGKITINGKEVKKILVDGKEFMTGDTKTAMKNLPTSIVEKVKAYDEKSDLARVSGIDDGEEQTVLDFGIKKGMNKGMFSNLDGAIGTRDRYAAKAMAARFGGDFRMMLLGNANNVNDMGFPGGGGGRFGGGRQGLTATKMLGFNMNYEKKGVIKLDGSVRWNHSDGDASSKSASENFVSTTGSFSNSLSKNYSCNNSWNAQMRLEWTPDTMTNIMFRPSFSYSNNNSLSTSSSATFNEDPYEFVTDPLSDDGLTLMHDNLALVNSRNNRSISYNESKNFNASLQYNRKLNSTGRNITVRMQGSYSDTESNSLQINNVNLYRSLSRLTNEYLGSDSAYQTNRYNLTPQKKWSYSARLTYSEPIMKATYLQFSYQFKYNYTKSDRSTYDFSNLGEDYFSGVKHEYRGWNNYLSRLDSSYVYYLDDSLSRYSEYKNYIHDIELMLRVIRKSYNFNVGVTVMPQQTNFIQHYQGHNTDTTRTVVNVTPTADFRWKISKVSQLRFNYRGTTSQPSMTDLLDIVDNSDPLNITMGNPGLKPSFTNSMFLFYNNYFERRKASIMTHLRFNNTNNSVANRVTYDPETGGRTTRPENINGNWNASAAFMYNTSIDTAGYFNVNTFTEVQYNNNVGYYSVDRTSDSQKNITRDMNISERLSASYRNDWLEFELNGSLRYRYSRNNLQANSNLDTWQFSYGFNTNIQAPWGTSLSTDLNMNSRRGYSDASLNTNELIWNAQVSQSFLKGKPLTVSLQFYDILHQQSNFSRTINAMSRNDTEYNAITSYAMLRLTYRLNLFGSSEARKEMRGGPDGGLRNDRDRRGGRGGGPGGPGGGFGGPRF